MDNQTLILVDDNDKFLGYAPRSLCHEAHGRRHRAFVTLLFNSKNQVLLQKRRHRLFDGFWDLTAISHPLHLASHDESFQEASDRALKKEMGIAHVEIKNVGSFNYFARDGENCENEYCAVLTGKYDGKYKSNPEEVYEVKKIPFEEFILDTLKNSQNYTPWAIEAAKKLKDSEFFFLNSEISSFLQSFEPYQRQYFTQKIAKVSKYPKIIREFYEELYNFSKGGKKLRAFLVYLGYKLAGGNNIQKILPVCLATELVHNFLLIHDDIIDKSSKRRGKATVHKHFEKKFGIHYGISQAIILGDIACLEAYDQINLSTFQPKVKLQLSENLLKTVIETAYGEALDVEYSFTKATLREIYEISRLKTAKYSFVSPLIMGTIMASANSELQKKLDSIGNTIGMAFQLQDDILGVYGDEKVLGKSTMSDLLEGKNTILIFKAKDMANAKERKILERLWGSKNATFKDLQVVQNIIKNCGALKWSQSENKRLVASAKKDIDSITENLHLKQILFECADFVISRNS